MDMPPLKPKKELQAFLGIMNYLSKYSPATEEVCEVCVHEVLSRNKTTISGTDTSEDGTREGFLQRDYMNNPKDIAAHNSILRPIAFIS